MTQTTWTRLDGPGSMVAPALQELTQWPNGPSAGSRGRLYAVAVSPGGDVVESHIDRLDEWSPWTVVGSAGGHPPLTAAADTSPVLVADGPDRLRLVCRGADNNLHVASCPSGGSWSGWDRLTVDASAHGRVSAAITESPWQLHVLYSGPGDTLHYRRFDPALDQVSASNWSHVREGVLATDGSGEVFAAYREVGDRGTFRRLRAPWDGSWEQVVTPSGRPTECHCLSLSNAVYHAGAFHVLYHWRTRRDLDYYHGIHHVRVRAQQYDDGYFATVFDHIGVEPYAPQVSVAGYRSRLVAAFNDGSGDIRYAWLDDISASHRWVGGDVVASGKTVDRVALAECNFRVDDQDYFNSGNLGWDLFALVRGRTGKYLYFINFSRTFLQYRLRSIDHGVRWCTEYPTPMEGCDSETALPKVEEAPVFTEIGCGTMGMPDELMRELFPRIMTYRKKPGQDYMAWVHNEDVNAYHGPDINVSTMHLSDTWHHEMLHSLLTHMRVVNDGQAQTVKRNLMADLIPQAAVAQGIDLFGQHTNRARTCDLGSDGDRCRGFALLTWDNHDVGDRQHSFIAVIKRYLHTGQQLRDYAYSDRRAGVELLWQKYCWVRDHLFGGVEFDGWLLPIQVCTIRNVHSGKALEVGGWDLEDRAPLLQHAFHGGDNQRFRLWPSPGGYFQIVAMHSGKALDVAGVSTENGAKVQQYSRSAGHNQQWRLLPDGAGAYSIVARHSGKCLEVVNWSTADGGRVAQYEAHGGANQKWTLAD